MTEAEPEKRGPGGRPSLYEPRFCEMVVEDMAKGYSLSAFAGLIGVSRATLNVWMDAHPEFLEAVSRGKTTRLRDWETVALDMRTKGGGPGGATITMFGLKNMGGDEWSDKQQHEMSGPNGGPIETKEVGARERIYGRIAGLASRIRQDDDPGGFNSD